MPPITMFHDRDRPNELIFPSCGPCNSGSRALEQIISFLSRMYPDPASLLRREEQTRVFNAMWKHCPEIYTALIPAPKAADETEIPGTLTNISDPYVIRAFQVFGAKLGFALHWRETGVVVPQHGAAVIHVLTNADAIKRRIPDQLWQMFQPLLTLEQGAKNVRQQFQYASRVDQDTRYSAHLATFRASFMLWVLVSEELSLLPETDDEVLLRPGCLQQGYPWGLPRLSTFEISARRNRQVILIDRARTPLRHAADARQARGRAGDGL